MKVKLELLIVEDDTQVYKDYVSIIENSEDMVLVGYTNSAKTAVAYAKDYLPDVIILELELHQGCGSGLNVLADLKNMSLSKTPYILITTNNSSQITYETARELGADYIMSKHQNDYSAQSVIDFLRIIAPTLMAKRKSSDEEVVAETPMHTQKRIVRRIMAELNCVCINPKDVGYQYLVDAIEITMNQRTVNINSVISQRYGKTEISVSRAMQRAIERGWKKANVEDLSKHYTAKINSEKGVPTITEFVCYYANLLNNEY